MENTSDLNNTHIYPSTKNLINKTLTPVQLKDFLRVIYGSWKIAAMRVGITESRLHQIFAGYDVPSSSPAIKRYSEAWSIDIVILTQIFEQLRNIPQIVSADKLENQKIERTEGRTTSDSQAPTNPCGEVKT